MKIFSSLLLCHTDLAISNSSWMQFMMALTTFHRPRVSIIPATTVSTAMGCAKISYTCFLFSRLGQWKSTYHESSHSIRHWGQKGSVPMALITTLDSKGKFLPPFQMNISQVLLPHPDYVCTFSLLLLLDKDRFYICSPRRTTNFNPVTNNSASPHVIENALATLSILKLQTVDIFPFHTTTFRTFLYIDVLYNKVHILVATIFSVAWLQCGVLSEWVPPSLRPFFFAHTKFQGFLQIVEHTAATVRQLQPMWHCSSFDNQDIISTNN